MHVDVLFLKENSSSYPKILEQVPKFFKLLIDFHLSVFRFSYSKDNWGQSYQFVDLIN